MIQVNELRIGNLVKYGVHNVPIKSINVSYDNEATVYVKLNEKLNHYCLSINEIEPIPITEEWLLKFWFEKCKYLKNTWDNGSIIISLRNDIFYYELLNDTVEIKYIHQLQNLYFALTGTQLQIT